MNEMGIVKGQPGRNLVYYYATIDAYSRVVSLHVTVAEAENAFDSVTALDAAFRGEEGLLRGIPETIYTDQGPLSKHFGLGMCMELGIDLITHEKRNSRAKGKVESVWRDMWTHFELPFLVDMDRVITLSELRAYLKNYETELNSRVCPNLNLKGSGLTRAEAYAQSLTPARFRPCPVEPLQEYARRTWQSTVDGSGNITKDKITYRISECPATLLNRPATCHKTMNGDVRVRNPITFEWMNTVPHVPVTFGNFRGYKDDENDRLTERSKELKLRGLLHATAPAAPAVKLPENVTDLAGVRAAKGARVFQNATDAALWIADVLGIALAELPLVILDNVNAVCEEHHGNGAEIERLAAALKGAMDNK